jgi:beta-galactosidase
MRDALDDWLGKEKRPHVAPPYQTQTVDAVHLTECAPLLDGALEQAAELSVFKHRTVCMEDLGQDYGFILYSSFINYTDDRVRHLHVDGLSDRATVYLNGEYIGGLMRDREKTDISFRVPHEGATLQILVENMGRVDYGYGLYDRKGILDHIRFDIENPDGSYLFNQAAQMGFQIDTLPLTDLSCIVYGSKNAETNTPCFYRGRFCAEAGVDTFLDMRRLKKGVVLLNGFNLGRYWELGPQHTLYVPGELIREENVIEVFELYAPKELPVISTCDSHIFINKNGYYEDFDLL